MAAIEQQQQQQQHPQQPGQERPQVTQLEFHQAMQDFKNMFPEMDEDVIEVVLRSNNGAVDATIDQLLSMTTDNENERLRTELDATENDELPPCYSPSTPPPSYHQAVPYAQSPAHSPAVAASAVTLSTNSSHGSFPSVSQHAHKQEHTSEKTCVFPSTALARQISEGNECDQSDNSEDSVPLLTQKKWNPPMLGPLPKSFLRLEEKDHRPLQPRENVTVLSSSMLQQRMEENERQRRNTIGAEDPELAQYLEDERIALFLQNEEFMQELRDNKEFLSTLERGDEDEEDAEQQDELDGFSYSQKVAPTDDADAAFREKLRNMGKLSRKKFTQLAKLFSRRKKRTFKPILGDGTNPSRDNLLLHEDECSELSEEDEFEAELNKKETWNSPVDGQGDRAKTPVQTKPDPFVI